MIHFHGLVLFHLAGFFSIFIFLFFYGRHENPPSIHAYRFLFPPTKALLMRALTPHDPRWLFLQSPFSSSIASSPSSLAFSHFLFYISSLSLSLCLASLRSLTVVYPTVSLCLSLCVDYEGWHAVKSADTCKNDTR